jgi:hypothetical protein
MNKRTPLEKANLYAMCALVRVCVSTSGQFDMRIYITAELSTSPIKNAEIYMTKSSASSNFLSCFCLIPKESSMPMSFFFLSMKSEYTKYIDMTPTSAKIILSTRKIYSPSRICSKPTIK